MQLRLWAGLLPVAYSHPTLGPREQAAPPTFGPGPIVISRRLPRRGSVNTENLFLKHVFVRSLEPGAHTTSPPLAESGSGPHESSSLKLLAARYSSSTVDICFASRAISPQDVIPQWFNATTRSVEKEFLKESFHNNKFKLSINSLLNYEEIRIDHTWGGIVIFRG
jgi:hypothetical protein